MPVEGKYQVTVHTPVGPQRGSLTLRVDGASLSGILDNPKGKTEFSGGTVSGNSVDFTTKIRTPMGRLKAHVTGTVDGDTFAGTARLPLGAAKIEGTRAQEGASSPNP